MFKLFKMSVLVKHVFAESFFDIPWWCKHIPIRDIFCAMRTVTDVALCIFIVLFLVASMWCLRECSPTAIVFRLTQWYRRYQGLMLGQIHPYYSYCNLYWFEISLHNTIHVFLYKIAKISTNLNICASFIFFSWPIFWKLVK